MIFSKEQCKKWYLSKRMQDYFEKNGHLSPTITLEFTFLKGLYWYLTRQHQSNSVDFKRDLYTMYTEIVNLSYKFNRIDPNPNIQEVIYMQMQILLDNESSGPRTFILLNTNTHIKKMKIILKLLYRWFTNPNYHGYASEDEFWEAMQFLRTRFDKIDIEEAIGKWPKKFRERFGRKVGS